MTIVTGIDLETTGLDPLTSEIIEIGIVQWDVERKAPISMRSELVKPYNSIPKDIQELTGITDQSFWSGHYLKSEDLNALIANASRSSDYLVAHNAAFEKSFLPEWQSFKWIDTKIDLPFKNGKGNGALSDICMGHGIFNVMPHRALPDAIAMMQLFSLYDFDEIKKSADSPEIEMTLRFSYDTTGRKQVLAKTLGYRWDGDAKVWTKTVKEIRVE